MIKRSMFSPFATGPIVNVNSLFGPLGNAETKKRVERVNKGMLSGFKSVEEEVGKENKRMAKEKKMDSSIFDKLEEDIMKSELEEAEKTKRISQIHQMKDREVNIMLVGATGAGKSSTINALFDMEVAKVGMDVNPETSLIEKYELENFNIWDTPGLGDSIEADEETIENIIAKLNETNDDGELLIDLVVVVLDASTKDLGMIYKMLNDVLLPCFGDEAADRVVVALNQADIAMKGKHWDEENNVPDDTLKDFLKRKSESIRDRIKEATGLDIRPVCYCAGYVEDDEDVRKPYNLSKLLFFIMNQIPKEKRISLSFHINPNEDNWLHDDEEADYAEAVSDSIWETVKLYSWWGCEDGKEMGEKILGVPGKMVGGVIGGIVGVLQGFYYGLTA